MKRYTGIYLPAIVKWHNFGMIIVGFPHRQIYIKKNDAVVVEDGKKIRGRDMGRY